MKQHWHVDPLPSPDDDAGGLDGFVSFALLVFVILGSMIYFGPELRTVEVWIVEVYEDLENWLEPLRECFFLHW